MVVLVHTDPNSQNITRDETARRNHEAKAKATEIWNLKHGKCGGDLQ